MHATAAAANLSAANSYKQQKQTAKEVIATNVQALIEQLEQGHSEALTAMGLFHTYSFGNILEIARQKSESHYQMLLLLARLFGAAVCSSSLQTLGPVSAYHTIVHLSLQARPAIQR